MHKRPLAAAGAAIIAIAGLSACTEDEENSGGAVADDCKPAHTFKTIEKGKLTVSGYDLPPYGKLEGNTIKGVDGDLLAIIAKKECLELKPAWMGTAAVIPAVQNGRADVAVPDWYRTAERAEVVDLTDPMYLDQMGIISKDGVSEIPKLKSRKVGTVDGYLWVADMKKYMGSKMKIYPTTVDMNADLKAGRIDVGIDSPGSGKLNHPDRKVVVAKPFKPVAASLEAAQSGFPVSKKNPELLKALNEDIAEMHKSGEIAKVLTNNKLPASAAEVGSPRLIK